MNRRRFENDLFIIIIHIFRNDYVNVIMVTLMKHNIATTDNIYGNPFPLHTASDQILSNLSLVSNIGQTMYDECKIVLYALFHLTTNIPVQCK